MSSTEVTTMAGDVAELKKRKREPKDDDLEIDLGAPEPPSKKALRKAKKPKPQVSEKGSRDRDDGTGGEKQDAVPNKDPRSDYGIWIGNLSFATTKEDLLKFMTSDTEHAILEKTITRIHLPAGPNKFGKFQNKGFAYIDFKDEGTLQTALELSEKLLGGRRVLIKNAKSFEGRPESTKKETSGHPPSKRIFVGNLGFDTTVEDLEEHFGVCGPIQNTHMATFEDTGKCKGYAWVEFEQLSSGQSAMRGWVEDSGNVDDTGRGRSKQRIWLNKLGGRKLRMEFAEDKTTRYNKRFGKNGTQEKSDQDVPAIEEIAEGDNVQPFRAPVGRQKQSTYGNTRRGYEQETVRKMTGAIVEGQGQKVTFD